MNPTNNKRLETLIYAALWLIVIVLFVLDIMRDRSYADMPLLDFDVVKQSISVLLPFLFLFALNNYLLIPKLLKRGHYSKYFLLAILSIAVTWLWQRFIFHDTFEPPKPDLHGFDPHFRRHLIPLPLYLDIVYDFMIVGVNLSVSLLFQQFADRLKQESLMKENAENQLTYLKAQINPHFYMNMLNNIHGMIEIDPEKAQDMVIEMSGMMRYMLYESSRPEIDLSAEIGFINDYLALMRVRYPEDIVKIKAAFPLSKDVAGIKVPPLLFLVFLENAFKHGISYCSDSFVEISLEIEDNRIRFVCRNSVHESAEKKDHKGIGLKNVKRRLDIIYGNNYNLDIKAEKNVYAVTLTLPPYEAENVDN